MPRKRLVRRARHGDGTVEEVSPGRFRARIRIGGKRVTTETVSRRDVAEAALAKLRAQRDAKRSGVSIEMVDRRTIAEIGIEWLASREARPEQHRNAATDRTNWMRHLVPRIGHLRPVEVDRAALWILADDLLKRGRVVQPRPRGTVFYRSGRWFLRARDADGTLRAVGYDTRAAAEAARAILPGRQAAPKGLSPQTVKNVMRLLSAFLSECVERGLCQANPWTSLSRGSPLRALVRTHYDPATVPYVRDFADTMRIHRELAETAGVAYAVGAWAGLRTSEVIALRWSDVDLKAMRVHVQVQIREGRPHPVTGKRHRTEQPLKGKRSRMVEIVPLLASVLRTWRLRSHSRLVVPPLAPGARWIEKETLSAHLRAVLVRLGLPPMTWYQGTRHTFGSHYVLLGGSMERLSEEMGHSSITVTQRHYAHLRSSTWHPSTAPKFPESLHTEGAIAGTIGPGLAQPVKSTP